MVSCWEFKGACIFFLLRRMMKLGRFPISRFVSTLHRVSGSYQGNQSVIFLEFFLRTHVQTFFFFNLPGYKGARSRNYVSISRKRRDCQVLRAHVFAWCEEVQAGHWHRIHEIQRAAVRREIVSRRGLVALPRRFTFPDRFRIVHARLLFPPASALSVWLGSASD